MIVRENEPLAPLTTFGVEARARRYVRLESRGDVELWANELSRQPEFSARRAMPLGGGSNVLFTRDFDGTILHTALPGREILTKTKATALLRLGAGEEWHSVVEFCVKNGLYGVENLALIPGNCGAAPMQNIGAYGVEIERVIHEVEFYDLRENRFATLRRDECAFGYRTSIFKTALKSRAVITSVTLALSEIPAPVAGYADVQSELAQRGISAPSPHDIFDAVIAIRRRKLPDPKQLGNAGSFFKNPAPDAQSAAALLERFHDLPNFPQPDGTVKIPAAWLIDRAGWKGFRRGAAGVSPVQALVVVNHGSATGSEIAALAREIQQSVAEQFGIMLEPEVNIVGE